MDCFSDRTTDRAANIFTSMVVAEDVSGTHTMWYQTLLIFTFSDMFPQSFHTSTVGCNRATTVFMLAFRGMPQ